MSSKKSVYLAGLAGIVVCAGLAAPASAVVRRHDRTDAAYLNFGASTQFSPVGRMLFETSGGGAAWNGSGTLIAGNWILTAAHVVDDPTIAQTDWFFDTGSNTERVRAAEVIVHPEWTGNLGHADMALVRLETVMTGVNPARIATGASQAGSTLSLIGYGGTGDGINGWDGEYDLLRRAGTNELEDYHLFDWGEILSFDFDAPADGATDLEGMLMFGDSGGAVMSETPNGWELVGVNSFIARNSDSELYGWYGQHMGATSVWDYADWINGTIPSPGTLPVFLAGLVAVRRRRAD